jgi:hypothetical protein
MKRLLLFLSIFIAGTAQAQDDQAQAKVAQCDKLPYRLGHIVILNSTDLRDHMRAINKSELKGLSKKNTRAQAECDAFVSKYPGHPVSMEFSYTVRGFAAYYLRCESFCGTDKDWRQLIQKEADEAAAPRK